MAGLSGHTYLLSSPIDNAVANGENAPADNSYESFAGIQSNSLDASATQIETTNKDDSENMTLLDGHGIRSHSISGNGIVKDEARLRAIEDNFGTQKLRWFRVTREDGRSWTGKWKISSYNNEGSHDGAVNFTISLNSSGAIVIADA